VTVAVLGCGPKAGDDDGAADGSESGSESADTGASSTTAGTTTAGTNGTTTAGTTGMTTVGTTTDTAESGPPESGPIETGPMETGNLGCGEVPCDGDSYCDWTANTCGAQRWDEVACTPQPGECELGRPVCGCDGNVYDGECLAADAGVDVSQEGGCMPPDGTFACGWYFCELGTTYCQHSASDVLPSPDGWSCPMVPRDCVGMPTCDCLANEPCADFGCEETPDGGLVITCPGG